MQVMEIPEVQGYDNIILSYRDTKRYEYIEKEDNGLSGFIIPISHLTVLLYFSFFGKCDIRVNV